MAGLVPAISAEEGLGCPHTIYAGSLDDPSRFHPQMVSFARDRPAWAAMPPGLTIFETMPSG